MLAYTFERLNGSGAREVRLVHVRKDGDVFTADSPRTLAEDAVEPCFSPDGRSVLFMDALAPGSWGIGIISVSGKNRRILIPNASDPAW